MTSRSSRLLVPGALAVWIAGGIAELAMAMPLKHDEAAYVIGAKRLVAGEPVVWLYRSVGSELLAIPGELASSLTVARLVFVLASLLVPIGAYALARAAFSDRAVAGWTAAVLAGAHPMILQSSAILGDLPAAGLILVALALLVRELHRPTTTSFAVVGAAPLLAAAFYIRYGSLPAILSIAVASILVYRRSILARPPRFLVLAAVGAALAIPHLAFSVAHTGTLLGVLHASAEASGIEYVGQGLVTYLTSDPFTYYGIATTPLMIVGIVVGITARAPVARYLALIAGGTLFTLGLESHAEARYAFPVVALLSMLGVAGVIDRVRRLAPRPRRIAAIAAGAIVAGCAIGSLAYAIASGPTRARAPDAVVRLGEAIRRDAGGRPCVIVAVRQPQLAYYSGCEGDGWPGLQSRCHRRYVVPLPGRPLDTPIEGGAPTIALADTGIRVVVCD